MARNYTHSVVPQFNAPGSSAHIRAEFDAIQTGFSGAETEIDEIVEILDERIARHQ